MNFALIIPAQETNKYHKFGDLAPFGDTTLLEWKISQCKEFAKSSQIYISSSSSIIKDIALKEEVNFIKRHINLKYEDMISETIKNLNVEHIIWIHTTSPFMCSQIYSKMYDNYQDENLNSLVSVEIKKEYVFYKNKKLNFKDNFISRKSIDPIYIVTNGCFIINKNILQENKNLITVDTTFFEVDSFVATEIKEPSDYMIAKDMISIYFRKELNV
ncbi:cytidylyltransferase domain-containing protein [Sulfurimonas sp.]|uniref:cytidylyltransferase domain-containing protein n=1 Tax=Sulfurimonas sp. TaxID=2022749 RepID=UPI002B4A9597|nr:hypothetical protein [Sulfurimonas sp.]